MKESGVNNVYKNHQTVFNFKQLIYMIWVLVVSAPIRRGCLTPYPKGLAVERSDPEGEKQKLTVVV